MLNFTGERYLPEVDGQIELEHLHRYLIASRLARGKKVLDLASGEGYGSNLLAGQAASVVGVDISREAVDHARSRYSSTPNLRFLVGDCSDVPLEAASFDVVVSFETIEHHDKHQAMMREICRVLKPNGLLVISSPDKYNYSVAPGYANEYHVKELYRHEFEALLLQHFKNVSLLGQRVAYGSFVLPESKGGFLSYRKSHVGVDEGVGLVDPVYLIALATDGKLPPADGGLLESPLDSCDVVVELRRRLDERDGQVAGLSHAVQARDTEVAELKGKVDGLNSAISIRNIELDQERSARAARDAAYDGLARRYEQINAQFGERDNAVRLLESAYADRVRERDAAVEQAAATSAMAEATKRLLEGATRDREVGALALAETRGRLQALVAEVESSRSEFSRAVEQCSQLGAELRARDTERAEAHGRLLAMTQAADAANLALAHERARRKAVAAQLATATEQIEEHRRRNDLSERDLEVARSKLGEADQRCLSLSVALDQARHENERVSALFAAGEAKSVAQEEALAAARSSFANLEAERLSLQDALSSGQQRLVAYAQRVQELENSIGDHRKIIEQIWSSRSWRLTKGLRFAGRLFRGDWRGAVGALRRFLGLVGTRPVQGGLTAVQASIGGGPEARPAQFSSFEHRTPVAKEASPLVQPVATRHRILLVSYYCPSRSHAGGLRILDLYALLRRKAPGAELHLYTHRRPSIDWSEDDVSAIFDRVYWSPTEELSAAGLCALAGGPQRFDVIDLQFHQAALDIDSYRLMARTILFTPMESLARFAFLKARSAFRATGRFPLRELARGFRAVAEEVVFSFRVDKVVCVSRSDAAFLRAVTYLRSVQSLETGVSEIEFPGAGSGAPARDLAAAGRTVLYVAYFGSQTNVDALRWYLDEVHPAVAARVPDYKFVVVGRGDLSAFAGYAGPAVEFVGEVPRLAPHIEAARVGIAPALSGSGFRGKVNQYALFGVPTVVSPISAKGLAYQAGKDILLGRSPQEFADHCVSLLLDDQRNLSIGAAARATCAAKYTWESKWPTVERLYEIPRVTQ
jgi:glycosyltransferase involved in cell wall biosynthesis